MTALSNHGLHENAKAGRMHANDPRNRPKGRVLSLIYKRVHMAVEAIIFDKDGVLLDLNQTWFLTICNIAKHTESLIDGRVHHRQLLEVIGVELDADGQNGRVIENGAYATGTYGSLVPLWSSLDPALADIMTTPDFNQDMMDIAVSSVRGQTVPKGDIITPLMMLKTAGYKLGVVTNDGNDTTAINLTDLMLDDVMDHVVTADSGHGRKPDAGGIIACCAALGTTPDHAVMIGDTHADHDAAIAAGCQHVIAITDSSPAIPDFMPKSSYAVASCAELPALMAQITS